MLSDARELGGDQQVEADVCIIGAGPAGISIARELIGNGARVWLLDSGGKDVAGWEGPDTGSLLTDRSRACRL